MIKLEEYRKKKEKSQYLSRTEGIMLQCQLFRFNVPSIICEVSEMKTVFRIKTLLLKIAFIRFCKHASYMLKYFFWQIAFISLHYNRLSYHIHRRIPHTDPDLQKSFMCDVEK